MTIEQLKAKYFIIDDIIDNVSGDTSFSYTVKFIFGGEKDFEGTQQERSDAIEEYCSSVVTKYMSSSGGQLTGQLVAQNNVAYTTAQVRNVTLSTSEPTSVDGNNGDI